MNVCGRFGRDCQMGKKGHKIKCVVSRDRLRNDTTEYQCDGAAESWGSAPRSRAARAAPLDADNRFPFSSVQPMPSRALC